MWPDLPHLPHGKSPWIEVDKLSQIFDNTTNSYKFFFFLSLIDLCSKIKPISAPVPIVNPALQDVLSSVPAQEQKKEPLAIPLYKVLWHMLELSFTPVTEFHVRLPYQDILPNLIKVINAQLNTDNQPLTYLKRDSGLTALGQVVLQDLCTPASQRHKNWSELTKVQEALERATDGLKSNRSIQITVNTTEIKRISALSQGGENTSSINLLSERHEFIINSPLYNDETNLNPVLISSATSIQDKISDSILSYMDFLRSFSNLDKYVPYRLLQPWIGGKDALARFSNLEQVLNLDDTSIAHNQPYYLGELPSFKLVAEHLKGVNLGPNQMLKVVVINPVWLEYLQDNAEILQSFAYHKLALKLESLNPLMPALLAKLLPQYKRSALKTQHEYFKAYLIQAQANRSLEPLYDVYTQQPLSPSSEYALDHFIPWSFAHHDLIWNLTPISPALNSSKSNQLPNERYIVELAKQQQVLLKYHVKIAQDELRSNLAKRKSSQQSNQDPSNYLGRFNVFVSDFLQIGQGYSVQELSQCPSNVFYNLLADQINPALQIASKQGFSQWTY